mmetsp:Transcript_15348/g.15333  ORF Transcript_15348/g.15333 Transcript_15348/m.15333 type:complete len:83 (+) Transcript_15348:693-941(+)
MPSPIVLLAHPHQELFAFYVQQAPFFTTMDQAQHLVFLALTPVPAATQILSVLTALKLSLKMEVLVELIALDSKLVLAAQTS